MPVCSFCKKNYSEHKGLIVFTFDGRTLRFCSSKCKRNLNLKRDPKKVGWIKRTKKIKSKTKKPIKETKKIVEKPVEKIEEKK